MGGELWITGERWPYWTRHDVFVEAMKQHSRCVALGQI